MATTFEWWADEKYNSQPQYDLTAATNNMRARMRSFSSSELQQLRVIEQNLNAVVLHEGAKELSQQLYNNLKERSPFYWMEEVTDTFAVSKKLLASYWIEYNQKKKELAKEYGDFQKAVNSKDLRALDAQQLAAETINYSYRLNKITGELFEILLTTAGPLVRETSEQITDEAVQTIIDNVKTKNKTKKIIRSSGASHGDTITYTVDEVHNKVSISSVGKVDVKWEADGPFFPLNISAKSYSNAKSDIHIYTGKILPLMAVWSDMNAANYYYNTLLRNSDMLLTNARLILAIQSLIGTGESGSSNLADVLITYNRSDKEHPVHVYSIKQLIDEVLNNNGLKKALQHVFPMTLLSLPKEVPQGAENYYNAANNVKLQSSLNRAYLTTNAISTMSRQKAFKSVL